jgi:hypothetical protein
MWRVPIGANAQVCEDLRMKLTAVCKSTTRLCGSHMRFVLSCALVTVRRNVGDWHITLSHPEPGNLTPLAPKSAVRSALDPYDRFPTRFPIKIMYAFIVRYVYSSV